MIDNNISQRERLEKLNNLTTLSSYYAQNMAEDEYENLE